MKSTFRKSKLETYEDAAGDWRWRLKSSNGRIIANGGEAFHSKSSCRSSWSNVAGVFARDDITVTENGEAVW